MRHFEKEPGRSELLDVIASYIRMIERDNYTYPTAALGDKCICSICVRKK